MSALVTLEFAVPVGHEAGDYATLHGNDGAGGNVDFNTSLNNQKHELFPDGVGIYGFGHAPFGHFRFGHGHSMGTDGFGHLPWGNFPFGHGTAIVKATHEVETCGQYKFGFKCFDVLENEHVGSPQEIAVEVHVKPPTPLGLKKNSYDKDTDVLTLDVAA